MNVVVVNHVIDWLSYELFEAIKDTFLNNEELVTFLTLDDYTLPGIGSAFIHSINNYF